MGATATRPPIWVVDETGGTFWFVEQAAAERFLLAEAYDQAGHLTISKVQSPADLTDEQMTDWVAEHVGAVTCEVQ